jgi:hypothetical protein
LCLGAVFLKRVHLGQMVRLNRLTDLSQLSRICPPPASIIF